MMQLALHFSLPLSLLKISKNILFKFLLPPVQDLLYFLQPYNIYSGIQVVRAYSEQQYFQIGEFSINLLHLQIKTSTCSGIYRSGPAECMETKKCSTITLGSAAQEHTTSYFLRPGSKVQRVRFENHVQNSPTSFVRLH